MRNQKISPPDQYEINTPNMLTNTTSRTLCTGGLDIIVNTKSLLALIPGMSDTPKNP